MGSIFTEDLDDTNDVNRRIQQATAAFYSLNKNVLRNTNIPIKLRLRTYQAIILNLLLWGCESWALKESDRKKLEVCHHRCLRRMLNITIYDVKEQHITNDQVREKMNNCHNLMQMLELRRARWLEKIAHMDETKNTRKFLVAWTSKPRPPGRPQQTSRHSYARTLKNNLKFPSLKLQNLNLLAQSPIGLDMLKQH